MGSHGGARPGAGRKPKAAAAETPPAPAGPRPTFGQVLQNLQQAAPQPGATSPPAVLAGREPPAPAAPPAEATPVVREENRSFARMVGYVGTNIGVLVIGDAIRKGGREPNEPSDQDLEQTTDATAEAIARGLGDMSVPWWAGLCASWGNLYLSMRIGSKVLTPAELEQRKADQAHDQQLAEQLAREAAPPAPSIGQGVPVQRKTEPNPAAAGWRPLPLVEAPSQ